MNFTDALAAGLFCLVLWQEYRIRLLESDRGTADPLPDKEYETRVERVIVRPSRDLESDAQELWLRYCDGRPHSRRHMAARRILSAHRWNEASALIRKLGLSPDTHTYEQGVEAIKAAEDEYHNLAQAGTYVSPHGSPY